MGTLYNQNFTEDVALVKKGKSVEYRAQGLKPYSFAKAFINDVDVTEFCLSCDVVQILYRKKQLSQSDLTMLYNGGYFGNIYSRPFRIIDYGLQVGGYNQIICYGFVHTIQSVSYNIDDDEGVANVYVFMYGAGQDGLEYERVLTANTTYYTDGYFTYNEVIGFYPKYSVIKSATENSIELTGKMVNSNTENSMVGTKIYIVSGQGAGQNSIITSYNTSTRVANVSPSFEIAPGAIDNYSTDVSDRAMVRFGELQAGRTGILPGLFILPKFIDRDLIAGLQNYNYWSRWAGWWRKFRIYDRNNVKFIGYTDDGSTTISTGYDGPVGEKETPTDSSVMVNPFAQTFFIDENLHPQGVSLTSIKILVKEKDEEYPIQVQIRPTVGSKPSTTSIVTNGTAYIQPDAINVLSLDTIKSLNVNGVSPFSNTAYYSEAFFNTPVFLEPGKEYAIVLGSASTKHEVYISDIGQNILGTNRIISAQPYLGVLYKMQNSSSWEPFANQDLCFELCKATYSTTNPANINMYLKNLNVDSNGVIDIDNSGLQGVISFDSTVPTSNLPIDGFYINANDVVLSNTKIEYSFRTTREDGTYDELKPIDPQLTYEFNDNFGSRQINSNNHCFLLNIKMYATNPDVAPSIDLSKLNLVTIRNIIDDNGLTESDIFITNKGQDYSNGQNVVVTISGGGGSGATARANVSNGSVDFIEIINPGSGYTGSPSIVISGDTTSTINAEAVIIGEDQPNGGVGDAKYITRKVTLSDGFLGGDLRVLFTAYKPSNATIDVYYKVLSEDDADNFDNKRWTQMTVIGGINSHSTSRTDLKKFIYAPGTGNVADNFIRYDGFTNFKYFAIKVVMRSTDSSKVPQISDFRTIALSELL